MLDEINEFKNKLEIGSVLTRRELIKKYDLGFNGGIRKSTKNKVIILVSDREDNKVQDRWVGDTLMYTGTGIPEKGDQNFERGNKWLRDAKDEDYKILLFMKLEPDRYVYFGEVFLADSPSSEERDDRKVIIFPITSKNNVEKVRLLNSRIIDENESKLQTRVRKNSSRINKRVIQIYEESKNSKNPSVYNVTEKRFDRNQALVKEAKIFANGVCQLCGNNAPFNDRNDEPFLEVHHINWLSMGGSDSADNVIALCPNCHRKMHIVQDKSDKEKLVHKAKIFANQVYQK